MQEARSVVGVRRWGAARRARRNAMRALVGAGCSRPLQTSRSYASKSAERSEVVGSLRLCTPVHAWIGRRKLHG